MFREPVGKCYLSTSLSRSCAKHGETGMDVSDYVHRLQALQKKYPVNRDNKYVTDEMQVQRKDYKGGSSGAGEQTVASKLAVQAGSRQGPFLPLTGPPPSTCTFTQSH